MANDRPLKLKSQKYAGAIEVSAEPSVAEVLVDTPTFHLDGKYSYRVPHSMSDEVSIGSLVKIHFGSMETVGYVLDRVPYESSMGTLKFIEKVISPLPIYSPDLHQLILTVSSRYGTKPWEIIRGTIPDRVALAEKAFAASVNLNSHSGPSEVVESSEIIGASDSFLSPSASSDLKSNRPVRWLALASVGWPTKRILAAILSSWNRTGQILVIVPDEKVLLRTQVEIDAALGFTSVVLGSHLSKSERYRNFLEANLLKQRVIIGTRSAVFTSLTKNSLIVVIDDLDESMYERRNPGWNVRDIVLLRSTEHSVIFISNSPSMELTRLAQLGWLKLHRPPVSLKVNIFAEDSHRDSFTVISQALKKGSVLVSVADPGYVTGFLCQGCKNPALCLCGGRLVIISEGSVISCGTCNKQYENWKCSWCQDNRPWIINKGAKKLAQDYARAFANVRVIFSTGDKPVDQLPTGTSLVIATAGMEPEGHYFGAALMDGQVIFNRTQLRGEEQARERWFRILSLLEPGSDLFVSLPIAHPTVQGLVKGDSLAAASQELAHRIEAGLPPAFRVATLEGDSPQINKIYQALARGDQFSLLGPVPTPGDRAKVILTVPVDRGQELATFLFDFQRYRSLKNQPIIQVRLDPYSI